MWIDYDDEADVLYISFEKPQQATDSEMLDDGILLRYSGKRYCRFNDIRCITKIKFQCFFIIIFQYFYISFPKNQRIKAGVGGKINRIPLISIPQIKAEVGNKINQMH
jgi:hypothetical protein